jgi:hypothetical protein
MEMRESTDKDKADLMPVKIVACGSTAVRPASKPLRLNSNKYLLPSQVTKLPIQQKYLTENSWRLREAGQMLDILHWTP